MPSEVETSENFKPSTIGNGTFMYMDFGFFFKHCWQESKYQVRIPNEFFDTEPFFSALFGKSKWFTK